MFKKSIASTLVSLLVSGSLLGCVADDRTGTSRHAMSMTEAECTDCELKEAIESKKGQIKSKEALLAADKASVTALKEYNKILTDSIADHDKKIATLKNSVKQGFKFAFEGAFAVLEIESLVGLAKNVKCLKPTSPVPVIVNGVTVAGPKILKFGLALKDPKKMKMFLAKATVKGTAAGINAENPTWVEVAVGYIPLTSAMKLPQRWNEWINADELIAVIEDAKVKVEADIATNTTSIAELEKVIPATEKRIELLKKELADLEAELANGEQCSADAETTDTVTATDAGRGSGEWMTTSGESEPGATESGATGSGATGSGATESGATEPGATEPGATEPGASCGGDGGADYIEYDGTTGDDPCAPTAAQPGTEAPSDTSSFPWGQSF